MAAKKKSAGSAALELAREMLRKNPKTIFAEVKAAAKKKRIVIYPITYGRAKALEGLVKISAYGTAKNKAPTKRGPGRPKGSKNKTTAKRGPGRPKGSKNKTTATRGPGRPRNSTGDLDLSNLVGTIKNLQRERDDALKLVEKIRALVG